MCMLLRAVFLISVGMGLRYGVLFRLRMTTAVEVLHVMVVVVLIQNHIEIAGTQPGLEYLRDYDLITIQRKTGQPFLKNPAVSTEVQKSTDGHVTADTGIAFQI